MTQKRNQEDRVEELDVDSLVSNVLQSGDRTAPKALSVLLADVEARGMQSFPVVFRLPSGDYIVGDGHRRIAVARLLGWKTIKCIVIATSDYRVPKQAFIKHAKSTRNIRGKELFFAWGKADKRTREEMLVDSPSLRNNIAKMIRIFGQERTEELALSNTYADAVVSLIAQVISLMEAQTDMQLPSSGRKTTKREIGEWNLTHKTQNWLTRMFREKKFNNGSTGAEECERILALVEQNKPPSARIHSKEPRRRRAAAVEAPARRSRQGREHRDAGLFQ